MMTLSSQQPTRLQRIRLALLAVGLSVAAVGLSQRPAVSSTVMPQAPAVLEDGLYLFGESAERDQLGMTYAVLSVTGNRTVGAFYQPHSSFNCFTGEITPNQLSLDVVDSYTQTVHPYTVAVTAESAVVAGKSVATDKTLQGFHRIDTLAAQDTEILAVCQADFAQ